ncbi:MAG: hypothetical protein Q9221_006816 [Calogaya cf. arnoldii]
MGSVLNPDDEGLSHKVTEWAKDTTKETVSVIFCSGNAFSNVAIKERKKTRDLLSAATKKEAKNLIADITNVLKYVKPSDSILYDISQQGTTLESLAATLAATNERLISNEDANDKLGEENDKLLP